MIIPVFPWTYPKLTWTYPKLLVFVTQSLQDLQILEDLFKVLEKLSLFMWSYRDIDIILAWPYQDLVIVLPYDLSIILRLQICTRKIVFNAENCELQKMVCVLLLFYWNAQLRFEKDKRKLERQDSVIKKWVLRNVLQLQLDKISVVFPPSKL